ncbi:UNVERIFIED_ORG: rubredoxin [Ensifer adhaerens]|nr:rubredoxin [Ensifer adhaerens]
MNIHLRYGEQTGELRAGVSGIYRCGSPWLCPTCSVSKAFERAERVQAAADATFKRGGMSALVVLTASHSKEMALATVKDLVQAASSKARKGRQWVEASDLYKILGVICGQEVTYSEENGWHYHQHLSVLVDGPTAGEIAIAKGDAEKLRKLVAKRVQAAGHWLADTYKGKIRAAGGKVSDKHGCKVRVAHDAADASDYTAKGSMAWEVGGGHKDETKSESSLTPWDIARRASDGDKLMFARWKEYEAVMPGTRSCVVSAALAKKLGIELGKDDTKKEDEQLYHESDDVVGRVEAPIWSRWMRHGLASTFLLRVEYGGEAGFVDAVEQTEVESMEAERRWEARKAEREREQSQQQVSSKANLLLRQAANDVRRHLQGAGTRKHIADIIERYANDNPDVPRLDASAVLAASNVEKAADIEAVMREIEAILPGRWLSVEEVAALRPRMAV